MWTYQECNYMVHCNYSEPLSVDVPFGLRVTLHIGLLWRLNCNLKLFLCILNTQKMYHIYYT
jgi:hypothetical protein